MIKEFIPYKQALALKELGFNEPCMGFYEYAKKSQKDSEGKYSGAHGWKKGELSFNKGYFQNNSATDNTTEYWNIVGAPLFQQAFRWFREKHNLHSNINPQANDIDGTAFAPNGKYSGTIDDVTKNKTMVASDTICLIPTSNSHEKAELTCLKQLIKIVK